MAKKSRFCNKIIIILILNYSYTSHYKTCCKRNTKNIDSKILETKNGRLMLSLKCAICGSKKSRFMKEQEAKEFLSNISLKTPLSKIPI